MCQEQWAHNHIKRMYANMPSGHELNEDEAGSSHQTGSIKESLY